MRGLSKGFVRRAFVNREAEDGRLAVYVHWPFCESRCPYCDFNVHVRRGVDQQLWARAIGLEIDRAAERLPGRTIKSIYFGGGTPSLMNPETVAHVIDRLRSSWPMPRHAEVSLEANPTTVEAARFREFGSAGVSRISVGVQALSDADLVRLGRRHTVKDAMQAIDIACQNFSSVSIDLMFARQGQTLSAWEDELARALGTGVGHLSLYQLTIKPGTRFAELERRGRLRSLPGDALQADMLEAAWTICGSRGFGSYEISSHARPGFECAHNLHYWRYGEFLGIGPGADGRVNVDGKVIRSAGERNPDSWLDMVLSGGTGSPDIEEIPPEQQGVEYLMSSLRLAEGADLDRYEMLSGAARTPLRTGRLIDDGLVEVDRRTLRATRRGRLLLDSVIFELLDEYSP